MSKEMTLQYTEEPSLGPLYRRIFLSRHKGLKRGEAMPPLAAELHGLTADPEKLRTYRAACQLEDNGHLPILYPYVMAARLHMGIMAHKRYPLSVMGTVHSRNYILRRRAIAADEPLDFFCRIGATRIVKAGLEFDMSTAVSAAGERVWESLSVYLVRGKYGDPVEAPANARMAELEQPDFAANWHVPNNMGRRYAKICGDYNPIHISPILAKIFGFKRDIIHGFWSAARCLSALPALPEDVPQRFDVLFKGPVFIGSDVVLKGATDAESRRFDVFCGKNPRPSINGSYRVDHGGEPLVD